jgi:Flp pilus assembly protein CpaB
VPLRALKILVVVMGIMLVVGFAALVAVIAGRMTRGPATVPSTPVVAAPLELPAGARIETIGVGVERLAMSVLMPDGTRELIIVDIASGRRLGKIPLRTAQ